MVFSRIAHSTIALLCSQVNSRRTNSTEPNLSEGLAACKHIRATTSMADAITEPKLIFILVPTPNSGGRDFYNHSILSNVLFQLNALRLQNKHVVISATVPPRRIAAHLRTPPGPSDARDL